MDAPLLTIDGLEVAPLEERDLGAFVAYRRDPDVARYQSWSPDYSAEDARDLFDGQRGWDFPPAGEWMQFAIRTHGRLLGDVAIHRVDSQPDTFELGVTVAPAAQGRGVATRVLGAVTTHLFAARGAHRVSAQCDARNAGMRTVLARIGFRHEGTAVDADWFKGEWTSLDTWATLTPPAGLRAAGALLNPRGGAPPRGRPLRRS